MAYLGGSGFWVPVCCCAHLRRRLAVKELWVRHPGGLGARRARVPPPPWRSETERVSSPRTALKFVALGVAHSPRLAFHFSLPGFRFPAGEPSSLIPTSLLPKRRQASPAFPTAPPRARSAAFAKQLWVDCACDCDDEHRTCPLPSRNRRSTLAVVVVVRETHLTTEMALRQPA